LFNVECLQKFSSKDQMWPAEKQDLTGLEIYFHEGQ